MIILVNLSTFRWYSGTPWGRIYQRNVCHICKYTTCYASFKVSFFWFWRSVLFHKLTGLSEYKDQNYSWMDILTFLDGYPDLLSEWSNGPLDWEWASCQPSFQFHFASCQALPNWKFYLPIVQNGIFSPSGGSHFIRWCSSNCKFPARVHLFSKILKTKNTQHNLKEKTKSHTSKELKKQN